MQPTPSLQSVIDASLTRVRTMYPAPFAPREGLLPFLQCVQKELGWVPEQAMTAAAVAFDVPENQVYGVASFYPEFRLRPVGTFVIQVCDSLPCEMNGCGSLLDELQSRLGIVPEETTADGLFRVERVGCLGVCHACPAVRINGRTFCRLDGEALGSLLAPLCRGEDLNAVWAAAGPAHTTAAPRVRLYGEGAASVVLDPKVCEAACDRALALPPATVIQRVIDSGLRGRGGAGFPTGLKWRAVAESKGEKRSLVVNADESEVGTFKDRYLLSRHATQVLQGARIAAHALGVRRIYLFFRSAYRDLVPRIEEALARLRWTGRSAPVEVVLRESPGGYLCGEETALIQALEGCRGESRYRPPYPTTAGLFGRPTVVNNVETLANVCVLFTDDGAGARPDDPDGTGTKLFCLSGDVAEPGIVEAPFGVSAGELIQTSGGLTGNHEFGFAVLGGAGGRLLHPVDLDSPLRFETGVGNGSLVVCHRGREVTTAVRNVLRFFVRESCGACLPCREGVTELHEALLPANAGVYTNDRLAELARTIGLASRCGLGQTATNLFEDALATGSL